MLYVLFGWSLIRSKGYFELFIEKKTHNEGLIIFNVINVAFEIWPQN